MASDLNCTTLTGRLTRDSELTATHSGMPVLNFSIAFNGQKRNQSTGEWEDVANYIDCAIMGNRAEKLDRYLTKGTKVAISGQLRYQTWERDGVKHSKHSINVDRLQFMSRGDQESGNPPYVQPQQGGGVDYYNPPNAYAQPEVYDEDCPF